MYLTLTFPNFPKCGLKYTIQQNIGLDFNPQMPKINDLKNTVLKQEKRNKIMV